eukprot:3612817-Pyramimonas_sp.AAC.1
MCIRDRLRDTRPPEYPEAGDPAWPAVVRWPLDPRSWTPKSGPPIVTHHRGNPSWPSIVNCVKLCRAFCREGGICEEKAGNSMLHGGCLCAVRSGLPLSGLSQQNSRAAL